MYTLYELSMRRVANSLCYVRRIKHLPIPESIKKTMLCNFGNLVDIPVFTDIPLDELSVHMNDCEKKQHVMLSISKGG